MDGLTAVLVILNLAAIGFCIMKAVQAETTGTRVGWCLVILIGPLAIVVVAIALLLACSLTTSRSRTVLACVRTTFASRTDIAGVLRTKSTAFCTLEVGRSAP